jgi:hypothetical protein
MAIDAQKLRKDYVFTGKGTPAELLADLPKIQGVLDGIKWRSRLLNWCAFGVGGVGVILGVIYTKLFLFLGIGGGIAVAVWASIVGEVLKNTEHLGVTEDILQKLSYDSATRARFEVTMRLKDERKILSTHPHRGGTQTVFLNPWLDVKGKFLDGTVLTENITDLLRERKRKNPRGKTKTKSRRLHVITMRLQYPPGRYGNAMPIALKLKSTFRLPAKSVVKAFKPSPQALVVKAVAQDGVGVKLVQDALLLGCYRILNLARQEASRGSRQGRIKPGETKL